MTVTWIPVLPVWLMILFISLMVLLLIRGIRELIHKQVPARWVAGLAFLRLLAILLVGACLLRPILTRPHPMDQKPSLLMLVDTSASMGLPMADGEDTRLSDLLWRTRQSDLLERLADQFDLHWFAVDGDARPLDPDHIHDLDAQGVTTDFSSSLETAWLWSQQEADTTGQAPPSRVIWLTDGQDAGTLDAVDTARRLGAVLFPIPAAEAGLTDSNTIPVRIVGAQAPGRVFLGSECRLRVLVRHMAGGEQASTLVLQEDGRPVVQHEFKFNTGESEKSIQLAHRPTTTGIKRYNLDLRIPGQAPQTNTYGLTVQVVGRTTRVLVLEDAWRWEFRYLRRILEDDPSFSFVAFLARSGNSTMQFSEPDSTVKLGGFPQSRAELDWFDIIVLGDVQPRRWPENLAPALQELVVNRGRSLIVIAGPRIARLSEVPALENLLPVQVGAETARPIQGPVNVAITREGRLTPFFYAPIGAEEASPWADLPPLDQLYAPLRKKPAATILAECPDRSNPFGHLIAVAEHTIGRGRVLYIGTDTLWKWHMLGHEDAAGNTPHRLFWSQTLRALAPVRQAEGGVQLTLKTDRTRYTAGQSALLQVMSEGEGLPANATLETYVDLPDGRRLPLATHPSASDPNTYEARLETGPVGRYQITSELFSDNRAVGDVVAVFDAEPPPDETRQVATDHAFLDRLAIQTGGRLLSLDDPATWPERGTDNVSTVMRDQSSDLWQNFALILLLALVLAIDWTLRLIKGYV